MLLLKQDTIKKRWMEKKVMELEASNSKEYKVEAIWDSAGYGNEVKSHLPGLYYLIAWKRYLEERNTWEPLSAV